MSGFCRKRPSKRNINYSVGFRYDTLRNKRRINLNKRKRRRNYLKQINQRNNKIKEHKRNHRERNWNIDNLKIFKVESTKTVFWSIMRSSHKLVTS